MLLKSSKDLLLWVLFVVVLLLIFIFFPYYLLSKVTIFGLSVDINLYDKLGLFIGGITAPVVSIATIILLYKTYSSQRDELEQAKTLASQQHGFIQKQKFETTFFNLLESQNKIRESFTLNDESSYKALALIKGKLKSNYERYKHENKNEMLRAKIAYREVFVSGYHVLLGHYFRHLYHILKFIDDTVENKIITKEEGRSFSDILQANLSSNELALLFYNLLFFPNALRLVIEFQFLENLAIEDLIEEKHKEFFPEIKIASRAKRFVLDEEKRS